RGLPVQPPTTDPGVWSSTGQGLRTTRGCDYNSWSAICRVADQSGFPPSVKGSGLRVARTLGVAPSDASAPLGD
ncbi:MAG: hypothetical protein ACREJ3_06915, partial [Polyangiaceae bacterium]